MPEEMGKAQGLLRKFIELAAEMKEWAALAEAARLQVQLRSNRSVPLSWSDPTGNTSPSALIQRMSRGNARSVNVSRVLREPSNIPCVTRPCRVAREKKDGDLAG